MASLTLPEEERNTVLRLFVIRFKIWMAKDSQLVDVIIGSRTTTPGSLSADDRDPRKLMEPDVEKQFEVFPRKNAIESIP